MTIGCGRGLLGRRVAGVAAVALVAGLSLSACAGGSSSQTGTPPSSGHQNLPLADVHLTAAQIADLGRDDDLFAGDLVKAMAAGQTGNLVLSPASIATALQMLTDGARGQTQQQLESALHASGLNDRELTAASAQLLLELRGLSKQVTMSNNVWVQQGDSVTPEFAADMKSGFDGALHSIDFSNTSAAASTINQAISNETGGHINNLVSPDSLVSAITVLTDAIYLHADWASPFQSNQTDPAMFTPAAGSTEQVPTMHQQATWGYLAGDGYQVVTLPYEGGRLAMSIFLPSLGSSPASVEDKAAGVGFTALLSGAKPTPVMLSLPKFQLRTSTDLVSVLQSLGVTDAFSSSADLSGICGQCQVSSVEHQAWIRTDEKGTTAAAATSVGVTAGAVEENPPGVVQMNVDRPFLAVVRDTKTGLPLFVAQVANPSLGS